MSISYLPSPAAFVVKVSENLLTSDGSITVSNKEVDGGPTMFKNAAEDPVLA